MTTYYASRFLEIIKEEGLYELYRSTNDFIRRTILTKTDIGWEYQTEKLKNKCSNESDANPFKLLWVDPDRIQYVTGKIETRYKPESRHLDHFVPYFSGIEIFGEVVGGNWDMHNNKFTEIWEYKAIKQRYKNDIPWQKTEFFNKHLEMIERHGESYECENKSELLEKCQRYESILHNIKEKGYKTQREQRRAKPHKEITVNISRNGRLLFNGGGRHRLSIAKVLDLECIPIVVKVRHPLWQGIRDYISNNEFCEGNQQDLSNHPDLQDIICDSSN